MLMRRVVIDNQMNIELGWHIRLNVPEEIKELLMAMSSFAAGDNVTGCDIQRCKQRRPAVTNIVVRDAFVIPPSPKEQRLSSIQSLYLTLLVDTQHHSVIWWIQIQADDIAYLLNEEGISGQLEVANLVGLKPRGFPNTLNGRFGDLCSFRHTPKDHPSVSS